MPLPLISCLSARALSSLLPRPPTPTHPTSPTPPSPPPIPLTPSPPARAHPPAHPAFGCRRPCRSRLQRECGKFPTRCWPRWRSWRAPKSKSCPAVALIAGGRLNFGESWPTLATYCLATSGQFWPKFHQVRPKLVDVGRIWALLAKHDQLWQDVTQTWPTPATFGRTWSKCGRV